MEIEKRKFKNNFIGICQGRLTNPPGNELQWFPGDKWIDEFKIAKKLNYDFIEILAERNHNPNNPIWNKQGQSEIKEVSKIIPNTPVLANTGVNLENVEEILKVTDGVIIGSSLKVNGDTWKNVDFNRAKKFMTKVKSIRKNA